MAFTAVATVAPGEVYTASAYNLYIRDNMADLDARMNTALQLAEQTITGLDGNGSIAKDDAATCVLFDAAATADINGCSVPTRSPWWMSLVNISTGVKTLKHENGTEPTPAKRFYLAGLGDVPLDVGQGILLQYVSAPVGARWVSIINT